MHVDLHTLYEGVRGERRSNMSSSPPPPQSMRLAQISEKSGGVNICGGGGRSGKEALGRTEPLLSHIPKTNELFWAATSAWCKSAAEAQAAHTTQNKRPLAV